MGRSEGAPLYDRLPWGFQRHEAPIEPEEEEEEVVVVVVLAVEVVVRVLYLSGPTVGQTSHALERQRQKVCTDVHRDREL